MYMILPDDIIAAIYKRAFLIHCIQHSPFSKTGINFHMHFTQFKAKHSNWKQESWYNTRIVLAGCLLCFIEP